MIFPPSTDSIVNMLMAFTINTGKSIILSNIVLSKLRYVSRTPDEVRIPSLASIKLFTLPQKRVRHRMFCDSKYNFQVHSVNASDFDNKVRDLAPTLHLYGYLLCN